MKMKVLYVFGGEFASGGEYVIERLINFNLETVDPVVMLSPGSYCDRLKNTYSFEIIPIQNLRKLNRSRTSLFIFLMRAVYNYFKVSLMVLSFVIKNKIKIVHANTLGPASYLLIAVLLSKIFVLRTKWVWSDHDLVHHSKVDNILIKWCSIAYNNTLVVSNAVKSKYPAANDKIKVLYNGLDPNYFKEDLDERIAFRKTYDIEAESVVLGIAGFIATRKGQTNLVDWVCELHEKFPAIYLIIAGLPLNIDDEYYQVFLRKIKPYTFIKYIGSVHDMSGFYNGCDIIVNNSNREGSEPLGTTIYEAMAAKRIVVASNIGGTPEIITDGLDGFLFEPENGKSFKEVIDSILKGGVETSSISERAREKVLDKFNVVKMVKSYNSIIQELHSNG